jgi:DNA mismatch repair protein MutS2
MIYPETFEYKTGFDQIRELLKGYCSGVSGRELITEMSFSTNFEIITDNLSVTSEMQGLLQRAGFNIDNSQNIFPVLSKISVEGAFTTAEELLSLKRFLDSLKSVVKSISAIEDQAAPFLKARSSGIDYFQQQYKAIDKVIDNDGAIRDNASARLGNIRSEIKSLNSQVARRLNSILKRARSEGIVENEATISIRNGRGVIPVTIFNKRKIPGLVHDQSSSGKTLFIEPSEIVELNNDLFELEHEERREIVLILTAVSEALHPFLDDLEGAAWFMAEVDFIRAKALLGNNLGSSMPRMRNAPHIRWVSAAHPLLSLSFRKQEGRAVVPLNLTLDSEQRIIVISGPNAGGKSVCLKTAGLLQYMLQCGLTIPVGEGSEAGVFDSLLIDIGDEQSIENDLSTYSYHLHTMKFFLRNAGKKSLVLIDEFGSGTEPVIGGAIAEAILTELNAMEVFGVITTHYTNLKHYASSAEGVVNGAMAFDNHLMQPLFRLETGEPGSSFAFEIARKIGLPERVLENASEKAGRENVVYDKFLIYIARDRRYWERKRSDVRKLEKRLSVMASGYEEQMGEVKQKRKEILEEARQKAEEMLAGSNRIIENTIREIKEAEAEKERTKEARGRLAEFRAELAADDDKKRGKPLGDVAAKRSAGRKRPPKGTSVSKQSATGDKEDRLPEKIVKGSYVKIAGSDSTGVLEEIKGKGAIVSFSGVIVKVPLDKLLPGSRDSYENAVRKRGRSSSVATELRSSRSFSSQLDLRGIKADEALTMVEEFLDHAYMISYPTVRILHGKGYGILRDVIRKYLSAAGHVKWFGDAPVDQGGTGITVVEMNI